MIVQPKLSLPVRPVAARDVDTPSSLPVAVVLMPVLSLRSRVALIMAIASTAIFSLVAMVAVCLWTPLPNIIKFVCVVVFLLAGCSAAGWLLWQHYVERISEEPRLVTQRLTHADTLSDMAGRVTMDTTGYLKAVRP